MQQLRFTACLIFSVLAPILFSQTPRTLYLDVSGNNGPAVWNNVAFTTSANTALLHDSEAIATGIRATVDLPISGANSFSATSLSGDAAEFAPAGNNAAFGSNSEYAQITLRALNTNLAYSFTFFGSRISVTDNRETRHTVTGSNEGYADLNAAGNNANVATVSNIYPRPDGTITLRFERGPNNTSLYYYLTAMKIVYTEPPPEVLYVDAAGSSTAAGWNLLPVNDLSDVELSDTNSVSSGVRAQVTAKFSNHISESAVVPMIGDAAEFIPAGVDACYRMGDAEIKLYFMNPAVPYTFTFFASRKGATSARATTYTVSGANVLSNTLEAAGNDQNVAVIAGVLPAADGTMTISMTRPAGSSYIFLNAFKIAYADKGLPLPEPEPITGKRLLFFGNQYTSIENVPNLVAGLAELGGYERPFVVSDMADSRSLPHQITQVDNYPGFNVNHVTLTGGNKWDDVVIQPHGDEAASAIYSTSTFLNNAVSLAQKIRNHASGKGADARFVLFQTFARAYGSSVYNSHYATPDAMQDEVTANYATAASDITTALGAGSVVTAPVGEAFRLGGFDPARLYAADFFMPGKAGPELAALTLYRTLYGANARDLAGSYGAAVAAGLTDMSERDWVACTHWADGLAAPEPQQPPPNEPEVILIDAASNDVGTPQYMGWNYHAFNTAGYSVQLALTNGYLTSSSCEVITRMTGLNPNSIDIPTGNAAIFAPSGPNNAYGNVNPFGSYSNEFCVVRFNNMPRNRRHTFTFYASRMGASLNRETLYLLEGRNQGQAALNPTLNTSEVATVPDIVPKDDGTIELRVTAGPNNESPEKFYSINAIKIESTRSGLVIMLK